MSAYLLLGLLGAIYALINLALPAVALNSLIRLNLLRHDHDLFQPL